jgi:hypothetical protein
MSIARDDVRIGKGHVVCTLARAYSIGRSLVSPAGHNITTGASPVFRKFLRILFEG